MDGKGRTFAEFAVDGQRAAMADGDVLDDGKAKTRPAQLALARIVDAVEAFR